MIRKLTLDNYPDVVKLWKRVGLEIRLNGRDHPDQMDKQLKSNNVVLLGKYSSDILLGVVLISHDGSKGWLNRLAVNPEYQRKGVAKELILNVEKLLFEELEIEIYGALVSKENRESVRLFEGVRYEKWEEISYFSKRVRNDS